MTHSTTNCSSEHKYLTTLIKQLRRMHIPLLPAPSPPPDHPCSTQRILVPRGRAPFGQHQESRPPAESNTGNPRFTDFPSLCACSESSLTNLIGSSLILLCLQSQSEPESYWTYAEIVVLGADQKERGLWGREWTQRQSNSYLESSF